MSGIPSTPRVHGHRADATEFMMAPKRRNQLVEAQQANRDLRNELESIRFPLHKRIRELEVERDAALAQAAASAKEVRRLARGMRAAQGLVRWLLASGKDR